jgi:centrosomal protein CEP78
MLDHMSGLRRVTLNQNPLLADRGATFLAEVIEADLWIKGKIYFQIVSRFYN